MLDVLFADPLLANACWVCIAAGAGLLLLALRDRRYSDTRTMRRIGFAFIATGVADVYFGLQPPPSIY